MLRGKRYSIVGVTLTNNFEELGDMVEDLNQNNFDRPYQTPYVAKIRRLKDGENNKSIEILVAQTNTTKAIKEGGPLNINSYVPFGYISLSSAEHIHDEDIDENDMYVITTRISNRQQLVGKSYLWFNLAKPNLN